MFVTLGKSNIMKKTPTLLHLFDEDHSYDVKMTKKLLTVDIIGLKRIIKRYSVMMAQGLKHPHLVKMKKMLGEIRAAIYRNSSAKKGVVTFVFQKSYWFFSEKF